MKKTLLIAALSLFGCATLNQVCITTVHDPEMHTTTYTAYCVNDYACEGDKFDCYPTGDLVLRKVAKYGNSYAVTVVCKDHQDKQEE